MKKLNIAYLFCLYVGWAGLFAGCAQLGLAPAQSFDQKLAYAYGVSIAVQQAATSELVAKQITKEDAQQVLSLHDQARALLDAARLVGDPTEAQNKLLLATQILTQLQLYLQQHRSK